MGETGPWLSDDANLVALCETCNLGQGRRSLDSVVAFVLSMALRATIARRDGTFDARPVRICRNVPPGGACRNIAELNGSPLYPVEHRVSGNKLIFAPHVAPASVPWATMKSHPVSTASCAARSRRG